MQDPMRPYFKPGESITCHAKTAVTGCRFVDLSGAPVDGNFGVAHSATDQWGVSAYTVAAGQKVTVYRGGVLEVQAAAAITAGQYVKSDATGQAIVGTKADNGGRACADIAAGATGPIDFGR